MVLSLKKIDQLMKDQAKIFKMNFQIALNNKLINMNFKDL